MAIMEIKKQDINIVDSDSDSPDSLSHSSSIHGMALIGIINLIIDGSIYLCLSPSPEIIEELFGKEAKDYFVAQQKLQGKNYD